MDSCPAGHGEDQGAVGRRGCLWSDIENNNLASMGPFLSPSKLHAHSPFIETGARGFGSSLGHTGTACFSTSHAPLPAGSGINCLCAEICPLPVLPVLPASPTLSHLQGQSGMGRDKGWGCGYFWQRPCTPIFLPFLPTFLSLISVSLPPRSFFLTFLSPHFFLLLLWGLEVLRPSCAGGLQGYIPAVLRGCWCQQLK